MMNCRAALTEANGDFETAIDILRKKGAASADKKASRTTKEGLIAQCILAGAKSGVLVEINCETDFVAKNDSFKAFCDDIARKLAEDPTVNLDADRVDAVQKMGENIQIRRSERLTVEGNGLIAAYIHTGAKVGVLVEVGAGKEETTTTEGFKQLVRDLTLQIAAVSPVCVDRTQVPKELFERERAIYLDQVPPGKPESVVEKIVDGKMDKFYAGICLVDQAFVKNGDQTISQLLAEQSKALGDTLSIRRFVRYGVGEGV